MIMNNEIEMTVNAQSEKQALGIINNTVQKDFGKQVKYANLIGVKRSTPLDQFTFLVTTK